MELNEQIDSLIARLSNEKLNTRLAQCRWDRQSAALVVHATFMNGIELNVNVHELTKAKIVKDLFQANLKSQFAEECEYRDLLKLQLGKRYTILVESDFGLGGVATRFALENIQVGRFAQYDHCIELIVKIKRKRDARVIQFYGKKSFALFEGWLNINTDPFGPETQEGPVSCRRSKYLSFDDRYLTDAIATAGVSPLYTKLFPMNRGGAQ